MNLLEQLKRDEGFVPHAYQDSEGWWTIGYGTLIDERRGGSIPEDIAGLLLVRKMDDACQWLSKTLPWTDSLNEARRAVLQNMAYNMGRKLLTFKNFLLATRDGYFPIAAKEMLDSLWARQVGARAIRLSEQMRTGQWV